jgi:hypothetical protein
MMLEENDLRQCLQRMEKKAEACLSARVADRQSNIQRCRAFKRLAAMLFERRPNAPPPRGWERRVQKVLRIRDPKLADLLSFWRDGLAAVPDNYFVKMRRLAEATRRNKSTKPPRKAPKRARMDAA